MIFTSSTKNTGQKIVNISFYNQQVIGEVANSNAFTGRTSLGDMDATRKSTFAGFD